MSVDAVVYYRVSNATVSVANVENAHHSTRSVSHLLLLLIFMLILLVLMLLLLLLLLLLPLLIVPLILLPPRLLAQTTLRNILGTKNLHEILSDRESISGSMQVS